MGVTCVCSCDGYDQELYSEFPGFGYWMDMIDLTVSTEILRIWWGLFCMPNHSIHRGDLTYRCGTGPGSRGAARKCPAVPQPSCCSRKCRGLTERIPRSSGPCIVLVAYPCCQPSGHSCSCEKRSRERMRRAALRAILWNHWVVQSGPTRCQSLLQADIRRVSSSRRPVRKTAAKTSPHPFQVAVATMTA